MTKALVISVGTGVGPASTIAQAIVFSVKNNNPDKIFYVVSAESERQTLPEVLEQCQDKPYEVWKITDPEDVNKVFTELQDKFTKVRREFSQVTADFTSGTKTMSAALALLGSLCDADVLSYVGGSRVDGVVALGTEKLLTVYPYSVRAEMRFTEAVTLFNKCQYEAALSIIDEIKARMAPALLPAKFSELENLARAYSAWDKFQHDDAKELLSRVKIKGVDSNKEFLNRLNNANVKESYYIADLINNAKRRGDIEGKYDDAVARLYRVMEMLAQWKLKTQYDIPDTGNVPQEKLPAAFSQSPALDGKIKLGLYQSYQLLTAYGDPVGKAFVADSEFLGLLEARNSSILAHGTAPVAQSTYQRFGNKVEQFATAALKGQTPDLERLIDISRFITWS